MEEHGRRQSAPSSSLKESHNKGQSKAILTKEEATTVLERGQRAEEREQWQSASVGSQWSVSASSPLLTSSKPVESSKSVDSSKSVESTGNISKHELEFAPSCNKISLSAKIAASALHESNVDNGDMH
eukprot:2172444-Ditylum_brightwellii.AAC.1